MLSRRSLVSFIRSYSTKGIKWEPWEDKALIDYVKHNGNKWTALTQHCLPNRSPAQCEIRWDAINPNIKHGPFSALERKLLQEGLDKHGHSWLAIQKEFLPDRGYRRIRHEYSNKSTQPFKKWTEEEDELLLKGVAELGISNWTKIAATYLPNRSRIQVYYRYNATLNPSLKKDKKLSQEELDTILKRTIIYGQNWSKVAEGLPGRTPNRCADAWFKILDPSLNKGPWNPKEVRLLFEVLYRLDGAFYKAAEYLPGRSQHLCRKKFWVEMKPIKLLFPQETQQRNDENKNDWIKRMARILGDTMDKKTDLRLEPNGSLVLHQSRNWTEEESSHLQQLVDNKLKSKTTLTKSDWEDIASHLTHRTFYQCKSHYVAHLEKVNRIKGTWSKEEDDKLKSLVEEYGTRWKTIAENFTNRSRYQCSYRWHRVLKYNHVAIGERLTVQEKQLVKEGVLMFGNNWKAISATYLPHRTPTQCMRWWNFQRQKNDTVDDEDISVKLEQDRWTENQDRILSFVVSGYKDDDEISWPKVASMVPGRNATQCRTRWLYSLKPDVGKRWTYEEEMQLLEIVQKLKLTDLKNIWPTVSEKLNTGRDDWQCRRKFNYMQRIGNRFAV
ncbi:hypothetical protein K501DRAFT_235315 [Backusella circina FSU 941]|nr:hypothetical protein K501DRAFT_235315 [Backusella circina FSU 941]